MTVAGAYQLLDLFVGSAFGAARGERGSGSGWVCASIGLWEPVGCLPSKARSSAGASSSRRACPVERRQRGSLPLRRGVLQCLADAGQHKHPLCKDRLRAAQPVAELGLDLQAQALEVQARLLQPDEDSRKSYA